MGMATDWPTRAAATAASAVEENIMGIMRVQKGVYIQLSIEQQEQLWPLWEGPSFYIRHQQAKRHPGHNSDPCSFHILAPKLKSLEYKLPNHS